MDVEPAQDPLAEVRQGLEAKKAILLDVREQAEWDAGHLAQAQLLPLSRIQEDARKASAGLDRRTIVYCYCRSGVRVLAAARHLRLLGFDARPLKTGFQQLLEAGFPQAE
jgi:phage shock protein E